MLALLRRLLPLALAIPALYAQPTPLDCNQPADVQITSDKPIAYVSFPGLPGDTVYIPGGLKHNELRTSDDLEILEISLPGEIGTVPVDPPGKRA